MATIDPLTGLPKPETTQAITTNQLQGVTPLNLPQVNINPQEYTSAISTASGMVNQSALDAQAKADAEAQAQVQNQVTALSNLIAQTQAQVGNKATDTATAYQTGGVNDLAKQLRTLNAQAQGLNLEAQAIPLQDAKEAIGTGRVRSQTDLISTGKLRDNALKALSIAQQSAIAQADYTTAKDLADQQITMKYDALENDLKVKQLQLDALDKYVLTPAQEKAKESLALALKKQDIADKKAEENDKAVSDMLIQATPVAPPDVLQRAKDVQAKGGTATDIAMALGQYGGKYWEIEKAKQEVLKLKAETRKLNQVVSPTGVVGSTYVKGKDPQADSWAAQIANKKASLKDVPSAMRTRVIMAMGGSPESTAKAVELQTEMKSILERMKNYSGLAIGPKAQLFPVVSQIDLPVPFSGENQTAEALADAERLSALLTTENIAIMKGLGSMSNIEFGNIEKIGSSLLGRDKEGNAYFKGNKNNYDREIKRLFDDLSKIPEVPQEQSQVQTQTKWSQGDTQNSPTPLSGMAQKGYIDPKSSFGTIQFILPTNP